MTDNSKLFLKVQALSWEKQEKLADALNRRAVVGSIDWDWQEEETCDDCPSLDSWSDFREDYLAGSDDYDTYPDTEAGFWDYLADSPSCGELGHPRRYAFNGGLAEVYASSDGWVDVSAECPFDAICCYHDEVVSEMLDACESRGDWNAED